MSDDGPTITVTRGSKNGGVRSASAASEKGSSQDRSGSSFGLGLPDPGALVSGVIRGGCKVWWAGLGVLAVAQNAGSKIFDALVEEGKSWEQQRRERTDATARQMQKLAGDGETIEAVEARVRDEVDTVLRGIGVPRRDDLEALHEQLDALGEQIERLSRSVEETSES